MNECPVCHRPKRPHHVCPNCKTYKGRDIEPLDDSGPVVAARWRSTPWGGPRARPRSSRARSRRRATGSTSSSSGRAGLDTQGLELVEAADVIEMNEKPADAVRAKPDSSLVAACRAVGDGEADAVVSAGNTGAMLAAGLLHIRAAAGRAAARRSRSSSRHASGRRCSSTPARTPTRGPSTSLQFAHMGVGLRRGDPRRRGSRGAPALDRRGAGEGEPAHARGARAARARATLDFARQHRGARPAPRRRRRRRHRRLHRQRRAQAARGHDQRAARRAARRDRRRPRGASSAAC